MEDKELFELCKQVYEATGLKDTYSRLDDSNHIVRNEGNQVLLATHQVPLYTSDYILEKLPHGIEVDNAVWVFNLHSNGKTWFAGTDLYHFSGDSPWIFESDTPLKALLKLTLALHEAGELK